MSEKNLYDESVAIRDCSQSSAGCSASDCASCTEGCESAPKASGEVKGFPTSITLTLDDDTEVTCSILTVFSVKGHEYIAVLPLTDPVMTEKVDLNASFDEEGNPIDAFITPEEKGEATGEVWLFKFSQTEDGTPVLDNIEDEFEYMAAGSMFEKIMENARKQEMEENLAN